MKRNAYYYLIILTILPFIFNPLVQRLDQLADRLSTKVADAVSAPSASSTIGLIKLLRLNAQERLNGHEVVYANNGDVPAAEDTLLKNGGMTLSAEQAEAILAEYDSPAQGAGQAFVKGTETYGIDNAWVMAMFIHESTAGKNGIAAHTRSSGNIKWTHGEAYEGFQVYDTWEEGILAHFALLNDYAEGRAPSGVPHPDIISALNEWAPPEDSNNQNLDDPSSYPNAVLNDVRAWREVNSTPVQQVAEQLTAQVGAGRKAYPTDDYNVNPNARFNTVGPSWSFQANSQHFGTDVLGVDNQVVYAPFDGNWIMNGSYPEGGATAGEYVMFTDAKGNELYLGHLKNTIQREAGTPIKAGDPLGQIRGDLAHTHIQLRINGQLADFEPYFESY